MATARRRSRRRSSPRARGTSLTVCRSVRGRRRVGSDCSDNRGARSVAADSLVGDIRRRAAYSVEASRARARPRPHAHPPAFSRARESLLAYKRESPPPPLPTIVCASLSCVPACQPIRPGVYTCVRARVSVSVFCAVRGTGVACVHPSRKKRRRVRYAVRSHRYRHHHRHRHRELLRDERRAREACARRDQHALRGERSRARDGEHRAHEGAYLRNKAPRRAKGNKSERTEVARARSPLNVVKLDARRDGRGR